MTPPLCLAGLVTNPISVNVWAFSGWPSGCGRDEPAVKKDLCRFHWLVAAYARRHGLWAKARRQRHSKKWTGG